MKMCWIVVSLVLFMAGPAIADQWKADFEGEFRTSAKYNLFVQNSQWQMYAFRTGSVFEAEFGPKIRLDLRKAGSLTFILRMGFFWNHGKHNDFWPQSACNISWVYGRLKYFGVNELRFMKTTEHDPDVVNVYQEGSILYQFGSNTTEAAGLCYEHDTEWVIGLYYLHSWKQGILKSIGLRAGFFNEQFVLASSEKRFVSFDVRFSVPW